MTIMTTAGKLTGVHNLLQGLTGQSVIGLRRFCGTWHFYFGEADQEVTESRPSYLGIDCPWRLLSRGNVLWGSEEDVEDPSLAEVTIGWNRDRILRFISGIEEGACDPSDLQIRSFGCNEYGDLRIEFVGRLSIETFSASAREMEWIVRLPIQSVVWMNGRANLVEGDDTQKSAPDGDHAGSEATSPNG
jgi:hypothetical protein